MKPFRDSSVVAWFAHCVLRMVPVLLVVGCGSGMNESLLLATVYPVSCPDSSGVPATDRVIIDWTGGENDVVEGGLVPATDFAAFDLADGGTLADARDEFVDAVEAEVAAILCSLPEAAVNVSTGESDGTSGMTVVHVSQAYASDVAGRIGEGEYDPCNVSHTNDAVIYAAELADLGGPYSFDEWVSMFANVIAHEIGHTLGYGHVDRVRYDEGERPLFVELMLSVHTVAEMVQPQRYLANDSNCPADEATAKRALDSGHTCLVDVE